MLFSEKYPYTYNNSFFFKFQSPPQAALKNTSLASYSTQKFFKSAFETSPVLCYFNFPPLVTFLQCPLSCFPKGSVVERFSCMILCLLLCRWPPTFTKMMIWTSVSMSSSRRFLEETRVTVRWSAVLCSQRTLQIRRWRAFWATQKFLFLVVPLITRSVNEAEYCD